MNAGGFENLNRRNPVRTNRLAVYPGPSAPASGKPATGAAKNASGVAIAVVAVLVISHNPTLAAAAVAEANYVEHTVALNKRFTHPSFRANLHTAPTPKS